MGEIGLHRRLILDGLIDGGDNLELDLEIATHRSGHGVLDEAEEPGLDPVPDQGIGDPEHDFAVLDGKRRDS